MARIVVLYNPLRIFIMLGAVPVVLGCALLLRFLYFYFAGISPAGHVQSLILAAILLLAGFQMFLTGVVADLIATNRSLLENALTRIRKIELRQKDARDEQ